MPYVGMRSEGHNLEEDGKLAGRQTCSSHGLNAATSFGGLKDDHYRHGHERGQ